MARTKGAIGSTEAVDRTIVLRQCPVTSGRPTAMTKAGFARLCQHHQKNTVSWTHGHHTQLAKPTWCAVCRGKKIPAELQLITEKELKQAREGQIMAGSKTRGTCECCGNEKIQIGNNYGMKMCTSCATVFSSVRNRWPVVVEAVKRTGQEAKAVAEFAQGEAVDVLVDSKALKAIAEAIGYTGEDGDGLVAAVETVVKNLRSRTELVQEGSGRCQEKSGDDLSRIYVALGIEPGDENQIDVILDGISVLTSTLDRYRQQAERLAAENSVLAGQVSDLERDKAVLEQMVEQSRERAENEAQLTSNPCQLGGKCEDCEERITVDAIISQLGLDEFATHGEVIEAVKKAATMRAGYSLSGPDRYIDSHLLDLALDAMRGHITGLDPDRIALIREAA